MTFKPATVILVVVYLHPLPDACFKRACGHLLFKRAQELFSVNRKGVHRRHLYSVGYLVMTIGGFWSLGINSRSATA